MSSPLLASVVKTRPIVEKVLRAPRKLLSVHDVDFVINPKQELIDEFMNGYGKERLNFKRNDIDIWKECFQDRYQLVFTTLKGTNRIVQTVHFTNYEAVDGHDEAPHQYQGFFWVDPEFRGVDSMKLTDYICKNQMRNVSTNATAQCLPQTLNFWERVYGHADTGHTMYVTYWDPKEMRIPADSKIKSQGIHVRSTLDVPDKDIVEYDQSIFPYERSKYILKLLRDPSGFGKVAYDDNGNVIGMGTLIIYPSGECVLTPLYANDVNVAQTIFLNILKEIPLEDRKLLRFQVRSVDRNPDGFDWIRPFVKSELRKEVMGYLCYSDHVPRVDYKRVFCNVPYTTSAA